MREHWRDADNAHLREFDRALLANRHWLANREPLALEQRRLEFARYLIASGRLNREIVEDVERP